MYLTARGHLVTRLSTGSFAIGEGAARRYMRSGNKGWSDIVGCTNDGQGLFVEAKSTKGVQSPEQRAFQEEVEKRGGVYVLARSVDDLIAKGL